MHKKLTKHGNSLALVIDKPLLNLLKIDGNSKLEISIEDGALVIRSVGPRVTTSTDVLSKSERAALIDRFADEIMDTYQEAFKKLAK